MTEEQWLAWKTPAKLFDELQRRGAMQSPRKHRLYLCACCRWLPNYSSVDRLVETICIMEAFVDDLVTLNELNVFRSGLRHDPDFPQHPDGRRRLCDCLLSANNRVWDSLKQMTNLAVSIRVFSSLGRAYEASLFSERNELDQRVRPELCEFVRDIFGNPFRPVVCDASWRTSTVVALAKQMYESRDFSAMPILADALQDAGWDNDDVLNHCRGASAGGEQGAKAPRTPHVRGCWVVDLLLGKE